MCNSVVFLVVGWWSWGYELLKVLSNAVPNNHKLLTTKNETSSTLKKEAVIFVPSNFDSLLSDSLTNVCVFLCFSCRACHISKERCIHESICNIPFPRLFCWSQEIRKPQKLRAKGRCATWIFFFEWKFGTLISSDSQCSGSMRSAFWIGGILHVSELHGSMFFFKDVDGFCETKIWSKECDAQTNQTLFGEMILLVNLQNRMFFPKKVQKSPWKHNPTNQKWYGLSTKISHLSNSLLHPWVWNHPKAAEVKEGKTWFLCVPCVVGQPRRLWAVQNFEMPKKTRGPRSPQHRSRASADAMIFEAKGYPTTIGFPTKNDHFGVFWGYHHLRKHPYRWWRFQIFCWECSPRNLGKRFSPILTNRTFSKMGLEENHQPRYFFQFLCWGEDGPW